METQVNLAYIPMLLHPDPGKVTIVGLGSGVTAGVASLFPETESIEVVELEPAVLEASSFFSSHNFEVLENTKVKVRVDDARSFLGGTNRRFDVIISETSNPWISGMSNLFSVEFFEKAREKLLLGGIFGQWLHAYSVTLDDFRMIVRSFQAVFPDATLWMASRGDYLLIGRKKGSASVELKRILSRLDQTPKLAEAMKSFNGIPADEFLADFVLNAEDLRALAGRGRLNTDDSPKLEFSAPRALYDDQFLEIESAIIERRRTSFPSFLTGPELERPETHIRLGKYLLGRGRPHQALWEFDMVPSIAPDSGDLAMALGRSAMSSAASPVDRIVETFDGKQQQLLLLPGAGGYRPADNDDKNRLLWTASIAYLTRISGLLEDSGRGGSRALGLRNLQGVPVSSVSYFAPVAAKASATYRVDFWLRSEMNRGGEGGVGVLEFDVFRLEENQFTRSFNDQHLLRARDQVRIKGPTQWTNHSFSFETTPETKMFHLLFYREGSSDGDAVVFDDVVIEEIQ
jgi:hypothetical protein